MIEIQYLTIALFPGVMNRPSEDRTGKDTLSSTTPTAVKLNPNPQRVVQTRFAKVFTAKNHPVVLTETS